MEVATLLLLVFSLHIIHGVDVEQSDQPQRPCAMPLECKEDSDCCNGRGVCAEWLDSGAKLCLERNSPHLNPVPPTGCIDEMGKHCTDGQYKCCEGLKCEPFFGPDWMKFCVPVRRPKPGERLGPRMGPDM